MESHQCLQMKTKSLELEERRIALTKENEEVQMNLTRASINELS